MSKVDRLILWRAKSQEWSIAETLRRDAAYKARIATLEEFKWRFLSNHTLFLAMAFFFFVLTAMGHDIGSYLLDWQLCLGILWLCTDCLFTPYDLCRLLVSFE